MDFERMAFEPYGGEVVIPPREPSDKIPTLCRVKTVDIRLCQGLKENGQQCESPAKRGFDFCIWHGAPRSKKAESSPCNKRTARGTPCKLPALPGDDLCKRHRRGEDLEKLHRRRELQEIESARESSGARVVGFGVDTLYLAAYPQLGEDFFKNLEELRDEARNVEREKGGYNEEITTELRSKTFTVYASGIQGYPFRLANDDFQFVFARRKRWQRTPQVMVQIRPSVLWRIGPVMAYREAQGFIEELEDRAWGLAGEKSRQRPSPRVDFSRLDITADLVGYNFMEADGTCFVKQARKQVKHLASYHEGLKFTGFGIGTRRNGLFCRIYDKTEEIRSSSGKRWFYDIWEGVKEGDGQTVWRVEFELKREILKQLWKKARVDYETGEEKKELSLVKAEGEDFLEGLGWIWKYLTGNWLSLRLPSRSEPNRSKWQVAPAWETLTELDWSGLGQGGEVELVRLRQRSINYERLVPQVRGCLASMAKARGEENFDFIVEMVSESIKESLVGVRPGENYKDEAVEEEWRLHLERKRMELEKDRSQLEGHVVFDVIGADS